MSILSKLNMTQATKLTQAGKLAEATTLIRETLSGLSCRFSEPKDKDDRSSWWPKDETKLLGVNESLLEISNQNVAIEPTRQQQVASHIEVLEREVLKPEILERLGSALPVIEKAEPAAAPLARRAASFQEFSFTNDYGSRSYKLYVPSGYKGQAAPLVIMLHGCTQTPDDFAAGTRMNEIGEEQDFLVAYPAQTKSANPSRCWNWFNEKDQRRDAGEPSIIAGITRQIIAQYAIDPARVYVAGLSAGGAAAAVMGKAYPDLYAAIGVHSGLACGAACNVASAFSAMRSGGDHAALLAGSGKADRITPTIVFHGDADQTVHPINAEQVIQQAKSTVALQTTIHHQAKTTGGLGYQRTVQSDESGATLLELWSLHGVAHAWSGGSTAGSYTEPRGPDASREMVRFFLTHPRRS
jgi:poly(hydroxyalkanoate) depolymerase family esterase